MVVSWLAFSKISAKFGRILQISQKREMNLPPLYAISWVSFTKHKKNPDPSLSFSSPYLTPCHLCFCLLFLCHLPCLSLSLSLSLSLHFHSLMGWSQCSLLGGNVTAITLFSSWNQNKKKALFSAGACFFVVFLRVCVCWASNGTYSSLFFFLNVFSCEPLSARDTTTTSIFRRDPPLFFRRWNGFGSEASSPGAAFSAKIHLYFSKDEMGCPQTSPRAAFLARIYLYFSKEEWVALLPLVYFAKTPNKPLILHFFAEPHLLFISRAFQKDHLSYLF